MKIRNGFVSNSSSSSFIVALDKLPSTPQELQQMLFGEETVYPNIYAWGNDPFGWPISQVVETLWNDLERGDGPITEADALYLSTCGSLEDADYPDYPDYHLGPEERSRAWEQYEVDRHEANHKVAQKFLDTVQGKLLVPFTYSDEDGSYMAALEHGPLFSRVKHLRISHH